MLLKKTICLVSILLIGISISCTKVNEVIKDKEKDTVEVVGNTPIEKFGELKVIGNQLSDKRGNPVQLKGMSTHGLQWFSKCQTRQAYQSLAKEWECGVVRLALYPEEGGYNKDPNKYKERVDSLVNYLEDYGVYCIIDWHVLTPGNPNDPVYRTADDFFEWASKKFKDKSHVIYEICNEPNGKDVSWDIIKEYADRVIPIIRKNAPNSIIISGTPSWSSQFKDVVTKPLEYPNIMYAYHFYAATHYNYDNLKGYLDKLPVFVTEWGTCESNGSGKYDLVSSSTWLKILNGNNPGGQKVSWTAWNFSDGTGTADNLLPNSCVDCKFTNVKQPYGQFIRDKIREN